MSKVRNSQFSQPVLCIFDPSVDVTGAFLCARNEARSLKAHADVVLIVPTNCRIDEKYFSDFRQVFHLPVVNLRKSFFSLLAYLPVLLYSGWRLARLLRFLNCERLQVNDFYLMHGVVARLFGYRGRLVTWVRFDPRRFGPLLSNLWLSLGLRCSDALVAVSWYIRGLAPASPKVKLIYDPACIEEEPVQREISSQSPLNMVYVGNYIPGKGQQYAITAFDGLAGDYPDVHLHFYGGDMGLVKNRVYRQELERQAASTTSADRIHFHEFTDDVRSILQQACLALNFSEAESFSLTCLEASAHGVPVIATRSGGPEEIIIDGETGFLVGRGDVFAMGNAMRRILADPLRAAAMGAKGLEHVKKKFTGEVFVASVLSALALPEVPAP